MISTDASKSLDGIAIIGLSGRFPGANTLEQFWHNLREGQESITFFSDDELVASGWNAEALRRPNLVKARGVLADVDLFDAQFFGYGPREADIMDPQQRLFLESAWESLEHAGYDPTNCPGLVGVYAGAGPSSYLEYNLAGRDELRALVGEVQYHTGNQRDHITTRVSYKLGLKGPSFSLQTACSSSLVAISLACQDLLSFRCDMALAGGVCITLPQAAAIEYQEGGIISPDGHCRAFDAAGQGMVSGSGVGVVVLKRLAEAVADGDLVHAVIKGAAINNDGAARVGYPAPGVEGQAEAIAMAQALADIEPETISYVEAHGTATNLGDPIEVSALTQVFRRSTDRKQFCGIGSVKSNIGHVSYAAGVAGLIKTVLALEHKELPPSLHFTQPNPQIDFANSPFYVNSSLSDWPANGTPRRAGVSSFGVGGTNAHVVLEEAPMRDAAGESRPAHLLVLSAKTATALDQATANLAGHLERHPEISLADVAYTLQVGRKNFDHRRMLVCHESSEAAQALRKLDRQRVVSGVHPQEERPVAFLFPGQGAQRVNMGVDLYEHEPTFRDVVDRCAAILEPHLGRDLRRILYPADQDVAQAEHELQQTALTQPALFTIEYALACTWMEWGIRPWAMLGHSIGEYVAACLAGVFSLEDALALVAARGRLMQQLPQGGMLAIPLPEAEVRAMLEGELSLAAINAPALCVVSGPIPAVDALQAHLAEQGVEGMRLHTSHAFHSQMMEPMLAPFTELMRRTALHAPLIPYVSNVTGTWITPAEATDPVYWATHVRQAVRFADGLKALSQESQRVLLETGPGEGLSRLAGQHLDRGAGHVVISSMSSAREQSSSMDVLLGALGRLWVAGLPVQWPNVYLHESRQRLALPTYPFERQRHWVDPRPRTVAAVEHAPRGKNPNVSEWFYMPSWRRRSSFGLAVTPSSEPMDWLVFRDSCGLGTSLEERLRAAGQRVTAVVMGQCFEQLDRGIFSLRPGEPEDYAALLRELAATGQNPQSIVHLWNVTPGDELGRDEAFNAAQEGGLYSLTALARALADRPNEQRIRLSVVANDLFSVAGEGKIRPEKATLLAACKVIPQEQPGVRCRTIDVPALNRGVPQRERLVEQILTEANAETFDAVVAIRGSQRWVQTYERIQLADQSSRAPRLRAGGVYLITGGLGGIGLIMAEYLARTVQARLVLVGRSTLPERSQWHDWLASHTPEDAVSRRIGRVQALEALGAEVLLVSADVASLDEMKQAVRMAAVRFGPINGVIHGAGFTSQSGLLPLASTDRTLNGAHFGPKAGGLRVLDQVLRGEDLDFRVLLSSMSAVLGGMGLGAYAAANLYMDAFAQQQEQEQGVHWISVNWDVWNTQDEGPQGTSNSGTLAELAILPAEGVEVFERLLSASPPAQVVVSTGHLQSRLDRWINLLDAQEPAGAVTEDSALHDRPALDTDYVGPRNDMEQGIAEIWQQLLGVEKVGIHDNFFELGGHSLLAIQLTSRLRATFGAEVSVGRLFEGPTVAELAEEVATRAATADGDVERVREMLDMVEQLSEEEISALLVETEKTSSRTAL